MPADEIAQGISAEIHPCDHLFGFLREHPQLGQRARAEYFASGRACALRLCNVIEEHYGTTSGVRLLEFAAGYGRVTRHLGSVLPHAVTTACDIHPAAVQFLARLGVEATGSSPIPEQFAVGRSFDVVFALSFLAHMPPDTWARWLRRLVDHAAVGGLVIFTTHGEKSRPIFPPESRMVGTFLFIPQSDQKDLPTAQYGSSLTPFPFVSSKIAALGDARLVRFQEAGWFGHQDLYVVLRTAPRRISRLARFARRFIHSSS